ncbi:MAG: helix-turn-helix transcriptional regulator, partial [Lactobacillus gasseri]|nr:helix-turn-helix transcriptional regulator [Lactobacillus gasseri]
MIRLRKLRQEKKLSLKEVSEELKRFGLNISPDGLAKYERGDREPKLETWQKLAEFFGVSVQYLQGISDVPNANSSLAAQTSEALLQSID